MTTPSPPQIEVRPDVGFQSIHFFWAPPLSDGGSSITSYTLSCPEESISYNLSGNVLNVLVDGLSPHIDYAFQLIASNTNGDSDPAYFRVVQVGDLPLQPPTGSVSVSGSNAVVSWTAPTPGANTADVHWYVVTLNNTTNSTVDARLSARGTDVQKFIRGLSSSYTYTASIYAVNDPGYSPPRISAPFSMIPPFAIHGVGNTSIGNDKIVYTSNGGVSWNATNTGSLLQPYNGTYTQAVAWNGSVFSACIFNTGDGVPADYPGQVLLVYSADGITWTKSVFGSSSIPNYRSAEGGAPSYESFLLSRNGIFYFYFCYRTYVSSTYTYYRQLYTSIDGNVWALQGNVTGLPEFTSSGLTATLSAMSTTPTHILGTLYSTTTEQEPLYSSTDGLTFSVVSGSGFPTTGSFLDTYGRGITIIRYDGAYYYAIVFNGDIQTPLYRSSNGLSWATQGASIPVGSLTDFASNGSGSFVVTGIGGGAGTDSVVYSTNYGVTWNLTGLGDNTSPNFAGTRMMSAGWSGANFFVHSKSSPYDIGAGWIMCSSDGATWTLAYETGWASDSPRGSVATKTVYDGSNSLLVRLVASSYSGTGAWLDASTYGRNATIENGTATKNTDGNGIVLDGSTNWSFTNIGSQANWSIVTWFKRTGASDAGACIVTEKANGSNSRKNLLLESNGNGASSSQVVGGFYTTTTAYVGTPLTLPTNEWRHVVITWNGTNLITYANGALVTTDNLSGHVSAGSGQDYRIGASWTGSSYMYGEIGELTLFNYPLTPLEVITYYTTTDFIYSIVLTATLTTLTSGSTNLSSSWTLSTPHDVYVQYYSTTSTTVTSSNGTAVGTRQLVTSGTTTNTSSPAIPLVASTYYFVGVTSTATGSTEVRSTSAQGFLLPAVKLVASTYSGTGTWADSSTNGKDATIENGTAAKNPNGNGVVLDGSTNWTFSNIGSLTNWTILTWFKRKGASGANACIITEQDNGSNSQKNLFIKSNGDGASSSQVVGGFSTSSTTYVGTPLTLSSNEWHFLAVTWDGTNLKTYDDGTLVSTDNLSPHVSAGSSQDYSLGASSSGSSYLIGELGEISVYDSAFSSTNVTNYYNATIVTYPQNLLVSFLASTYSGTGDWTDDSTYGNDASLSTGTAAKNIAGNGIVLDGSTYWGFSPIGYHPIFTISAWFKRTADAANGGLVCGGSGAFNTVNMLLVGDATTGLRGGYGNFFNYLGGTVVFPLDEWHHIAVAWDGTNVYTYLDGSLEDTTNQASTVPNVNLSYRIGATSSGATITGEIGAVQIYNYPMSATDVADYYAATSSTY
uniref:Fibronectin type-III domain-containing protein n=1 Tax=viral metagenome TaxID=1070528 RepID=A0A6C0DR68_9ZZZZ